MTTVASGSDSAGGHTSWQPVTPEIIALAIRFKADAEQKLGAVFQLYVPIDYATQVVAGTKFFIIVEISKNENFQGNIEVEIFEDLHGKFTFINAFPLFTSNSAGVSSGSASGGWLPGWNPQWGIGPAKPPTDSSGGWLPGWNPQWGIGPAKPPTDSSGGWLPGWNPLWGVGPAKPPTDDDGGWLPGWNPLWGVGPAKPPHWHHAWGPGPVVPPWLSGWNPLWGVGPAKPPHWHGAWGPGPVVPPWLSGWNPLWSVGPVIPQGSGTTSATPKAASDAAESSLIAAPPDGWWLRITPQVAKWAEQVKDQVEQKLGQKFKIYVPVEYQPKGSFGSTLYRIAVETGEFTTYLLGVPQVRKFYTEVDVIVNSASTAAHFVNAEPLLNGLPPILPHGPPIPSASSSSKKG